MDIPIKPERDLETSGRWSESCRAAGPQPLERQPYEAPKLRLLATKTVTQAVFEQGWMAPGPDGRPERQDYVVLAYVVVDPEESPDKRP